MPDSKDKFAGALLENRFRVEFQLGRGGLGAVYKGTDEHRRMDVAIKFLLVDGEPDEAEKARFKQEAILLNELDHENVVHIFGFGTHPELGTYLIIEYFNGQGLDSLLEQRGKFPIDETVELLLYLCDGLIHAHEIGVIHRDIKPANLMMIMDEGKQVLKILDFGIAKSMSKDKQLGITRKGEVFGSPLYMSPEQCQAHPLDARTDIYSIGCIAYELLTGQPPIEADTWMATVVKHVTEMPVPPREINPEISEALNDTIMRCLQKKKEDRFASVSDLREALVAAR